MKKFAFTLAEVLVTLVVIGVVAALVIPSVIKNYNDKKYNTARLKALKTFGEAGKMASINGEINGQPTAKDFVNNVLSKYLKIAKVCDKAEECGFPTQIQPLNISENKLTSNNITWWHLGAGDSIMSDRIVTTNANWFTYIVTADGFSAKVFYNPKCARNSREVSVGSDEGNGSCIYKECASRALDQACLNVIYDMNGAKAPNHVGEDVSFVTTFWSGLNSVSVAPGLLPYDIAKAIYDEGAVTGDVAQFVCTNHGGSKTLYTLPSVDELSAIMLNYKLIPIPYAGYWSGSSVPDRGGYIWEVNINWNTRWHFRTSYSRSVWCVRR